MEISEKVKDFISKGKTDKAIKLLSENIKGKDNEIENQLITLIAKYKSNRKSEMLGLNSSDEIRRVDAQINNALLTILGEIDELNELNELNGNSTTETKTAATIASTPPPPKNQVFISYNHGDKEIANKLAAALKNNNIPVILDSEAMQAGTDIKEFIEESVKKAAVTLSLVSKKSLLSAWVSMESVNSFYKEKTTTSKFIACYIDDDFFNRNFTDNALDVIDNEIDEISKTITKRLERNRNIRDLQNELSRYKDLQHNIDEIIRRLRDSLCIDIRDDKFEAGIEKIITAIG